MMSFHQHAKQTFADLEASALCVRVHDCMVLICNTAVAKYSRMTSADHDELPPMTAILSLCTALRQLHD